MKQKRLLPSKKDLIAEVAHWKWQALTLAGQTSPWLMMPGLIVYVNTTDLSDVDARIECLDLAMKTLRKRAASRSNTKISESAP